MLLNACILLKVVPTAAESILNAVQKVEKVVNAFFVYGRFDIAVFVEVENYEELRDITSQINCVPGVRSTETLAEA
jgi:DNA-binding Lrp family transcriptional regulator